MTQLERMIREHADYIKKADYAEHHARGYESDVLPDYFFATITDPKQRAKIRKKSNQAKKMEKQFYKKRDMYNKKAQALDKKIKKEMTGHHAYKREFKQRYGR